MSDLKVYSLAEFLTQENTNFKSKLPLVHSTEGVNIYKIINEGRIQATPCDTFTGENLAYFFHGRPSYRRFNSDPQEWELPIVLILRSTCLLTVKRVYPFDSGALHSKRLPKYLDGFKHFGYDVSSNPNAIDLLVDIFFGGDTAYYHSKAKDFELVKQNKKLTMRYAQVLALCSLYNKRQVTADDRSLAIEVQADTDVTIQDNILGVVLPRPFFDDSELKKYFRSHKVLVKHYDVYEISIESYISKIYDEVKAIYLKLGLFNE